MAGRELEALYFQRFLGRLISCLCRLDAEEGRTNLSRAGLTTGFIKGFEYGSLGLLYQPEYAGFLTVGVDGAIDGEAKGAV